jgi:hypothetical protein
VKVASGMKAIVVVCIIMRTMPLKNSTDHSQLDTIGTLCPA